MSEAMQPQPRLLTLNRCQQPIDSLDQLVSMQSAAASMASGLPLQLAIQGRALAPSAAASAHPPNAATRSAPAAAAAASTPHPSAAPVSLATHPFEPHSRTPMTPAQQQSHAHLPRAPMQLPPPPASAASAARPPQRARATAPTSATASKAPAPSSAAARLDCGCGCGRLSLLLGEQLQRERQHARRLAALLHADVSEQKTDAAVAHPRVAAASEERKGE